MSLTIAGLVFSARLIVFSARLRVLHGEVCSGIFANFDSVLAGLDTLESRRDH